MLFCRCDAFDGLGTFCMWLTSKFSITLRIGKDRLWSDHFFFNLHFDLHGVWTRVTNCYWCPGHHHCAKAVLLRDPTEWAPAMGLGITGPQVPRTYKNTFTKRHLVTSFIRDLGLRAERPENITLNLRSQNQLFRLQRNPSPQHWSHGLGTALTFWRCSVVDVACGHS